ncbi:hypothetical protein [Moritella sp. 24]|uniref:hypothetical protein n=1 Tax=Moritella sp. 24 TaxID=2746230 RepID=UPI002106D041|nr:hypothetical protein [Moritella sp. 24]
MRKLILPLLMSSMVTFTAQAEDTNINSHESFKNNLDVSQKDFYRGLRFEDWTTSGLTEAEIKAVMQNIKGNGELRDQDNLNKPQFWTYEFSQAADLLLAQAEQISEPRA